MKEEDSLLIPKTAAAAATSQVHILASLVGSHTPQWSPPSHQPVVSAEEAEEEVAEGRQDTLIWGDLRDHGGQHDFSDDDLELQIAVDWLALGNQVPLMASFAGDWAGLLIDD